jgi:hypothetical protein
MTKAERTKKYIVEKAADLINRKGIAGTSLSDIMEATQLAKGGVYGNLKVRTLFVVRHLITSLKSNTIQSNKNWMNNRQQSLSYLHCLNIIISG